MSEALGSLSYGVYLPRTRLQRDAIYRVHVWFTPELKTLAKGERVAANWDEDSITMGVEAARDALAQLDRNLQLLGRAASRQRRNPPSLALSHNLGGIPSHNVAAVAIVGLASV